MIGSPFYYDVLFDEGPGDVVFHDCMWSGICTCCIQLLHQDSYQFANESPDLKLEDSHCRTQINHAAHSANHNTITSTTSASSHQLNQQLHQAQQQQQLQHQLNGLVANRIGHLDQPAPIAQRHSPDGQHQQHLGGAAAALAQANQCHRTCPDDSTNSSTITSSSATITLGARAAPANCLTHYQDINSSSASSSSSSPAPANSSSASSPHCNSHHSNSSASSPKPIRRREHNDSERKRRDHLRNAFNFLRDQVPRFKTISKKPPRIQILHEATKYVQIVMREAEELERRLQEERAKHERNMKLSMK